MNAPTLLGALKSLRDELEARYDGAPDSPTRWMGSGLAALDQLIDGRWESGIREKLAERPLVPHC